MSRSDDPLLNSDGHVILYGGFWRRSLSYLVDAVPITILMTVVFLLFTDFGDVLMHYLRAPDDADARRVFFSMRAKVRTAAGIVLVFYGTVAEASPLQATLGKRWLGMRVTDLDGQRLTMLRAFCRNAIKLFSTVMVLVGCIWIAFSRRKRGWHDYFAGTLVVRRPLRKRTADTPRG